MRRNQPGRKSLEKTTTTMMMKTPVIFIAIEITVGSEKNVALVRAVNNNDITCIQVHSFVKKLHKSPYQEAISHSSQGWYANVPPLTG